MSSEYVRPRYRAYEYGSHRTHEYLTKKGTAIPSPTPSPSTSPSLTPIASLSPMASSRQSPSLSPTQPLPRQRRGLLDLPPELFVHGIFLYLDDEDIDNLRHVSIRLASVVRIVLFETIAINFWKGTGPIKTRIERFLSSGGKYHSSTKTLKLVLNKDGLKTVERIKATEMVFSPIGLTKFLQKMPRLVKVVIDFRAAVDKDLVNTKWPNFHNLIVNLSPGTNPASHIQDLELLHVPVHLFEIDMTNPMFDALKLALFAFIRLKLCLGLVLQKFISFGHWMDACHCLMEILNPQQFGTYIRVPCVPNKEISIIRMCLGILAASERLKDFSFSFLPETYRKAEAWHPDMCKSYLPSADKAPGFGPDPFHCILTPFDEQIVTKRPSELESDINKYISLRVNTYNPHEATEHLKLPFAAWDMFKTIHFTHLKRLELSDFLLRPVSYNSFINCLAAQIRHVTKLDIFHATLLWNKDSPLIFLWRTPGEAVTWKNLFEQVKQQAGNNIALEEMNMWKIRHAPSLRLFDETKPGENSYLLDYDEMMEVCNVLVD